MNHKIIIDDSMEMGDKVELATPKEEVQTGTPITPKRRMILNPNQDTVYKIINRIFKCYGKCPCQPINTDEDTRCPCFDFINMGICHCHLFVPEEEK